MTRFEVCLKAYDSLPQAVLEIERYLHFYDPYQIALEILRLNAVMRSWEALLVAEINCVSYHERCG
ncbi:hypothetical protein BH20PSE1_BH20PSE1_15580 [soil metagenome]